MQMKNRKRGWVRWERRRGERRWSVAGKTRAQGRRATIGTALRLESETREKRGGGSSEGYGHVGQSRKCGPAAG
jgi:hypothetical protein